mmetsp:Transcript_23007/g.72397  ORF Transcript_23007/g.72397 Transcript_23007/m.72397 type:complete len:223 (-) Transcript_23007:58-726(-)
MDLDELQRSTVARGPLDGSEAQHRPGALLCAQDPRPQCLAMGRRSDRHASFDLLQDAEDAGCWIVRLQRHVGSTRHQRAVDGDDHADAAVKEQGHHGVVADSVVSLQHLGEREAERVELAVGVGVLSAILFAFDERPAARHLVGALQESLVHLPWLVLGVVGLVAPGLQHALLRGPDGRQVLQRCCELRLLARHEAEECTQLALEIRGAVHAEEVLPEEQLQ